MKILHYAVLLMHFNDKNAQRETYPQWHETETHNYETFW
jgi:hypothetical protein